MTTSCFLIPVHPKHYEYVYAIIRQQNCPFPIYFCFTDRKDYSTFEMKDALKSSQYHAIIIEDLIRLDHETRQSFDRVGSWINVKKLLGLKFIFKNTSFDHILIVDAEIRFIVPSINPSAMLYELFVQKSVSSKVIIGTDLNGRSEVVQSINLSSMSVLPSNWLPRLSMLTNNGQFLAWWTNVPIYERKYLKDFFNMIGDDFVDKLVYRSFDHVIYYLFLAFRGYISFINVPYGLEPSPYLSHFQEVYNSYPLLWVNNKIYSKHKDWFIDKPDIFMVFHLDRA